MDRIVHLELDFRLLVEPGYLAVALPKLSVVAINKLLCSFRSLGIVGANEFNRCEEMTVGTDDISAIFRHQRGVRWLGNDSHSPIFAAVSACWAS
jgi:hypothetical protein